MIDSDDVKPLTREELAALDGDVGIRKAFVDGAEIADIVCPREQWDALVRTARAGLEDRKRLDWPDAECPNVSFAVTPQSGPWLNVGPNETARAAIDAARRRAGA